jgi:glycosyltransferase involved in cell wall biosynthesis
LVGTGTKVTLLSTHVPGNGLAVNPDRERYEVVLFEAEDGSLAGARQIYKAIINRSRDFDLIHIHSFWNFVVTAAAAAARKANIPYVIAPMGMLSDLCVRQRNYVLKRAYSWAYDRRTVEGAASLHFGNPDELRTLHQGWFRYPKHFFARNGTDLNISATRAGSFREQFPELTNRRIMLFFGRLHPIKGLDLQLQALERLIPKYPDLIWVLVGPDDGEWQRLHTMIRSAGLEAHVKWIGPLMGNERFSALVDADVLVQTSLYECQSMTVNEGLAVGVPLVVTDSINYSEIQTAGAGYVVKRDPDEVAGAIDAIFQTPEMSEGMRAAGRRFAVEELSGDRIAGIINAAYGEVLSGLDPSSCLREIARQTATVSDGSSI